MPAALMYNLCDEKYNWYYHTEPQEFCNNRKMYWPRGRVLGGSSSLNAMVYIRGHALDYDNWEDMGAEGWNYQNCLPYFKKAQTHELGEGEYRGGSGKNRKSKKDLQGLGRILSRSGCLKKFEFLRHSASLLRKPCFGLYQFYIELKTKKLLTTPSNVLPLHLVFS